MMDICRYPSCFEVASWVLRPQPAINLDHMTGLELLLTSICYNATFCGTFYDNPVLDSQLSNKQNELLALRNEINGKHLRIGTINNYPLSWVVKNEHGQLEGKGVAFVLVEILQKRFNFTYDVLVPDHNREGDSAHLDGTLLGLINNSKVDMGAAFLPMLYDSNKVISFSPGLDEGVWMMLLKRPKESAAGSGLLAPFEEHVWYLILAAVAAYGPCITLLTYLRKKLIGEENPIQLSPSCWFVYGAFIKQGTSLSPEANTTRVLFATWWIFIILLSAFYTANLTAFLTLSKFTLDIEKPEDLYKKNYRWIAKDGAAVEYVVNDPNEDLHYLFQMVMKGRGEFRAAANDQQYLASVRGGAVLVQDQTAVDHLMYGDYLQKAREDVTESDRCTYVVATNPFMKKMRAFAFPRNSTISVLFNTVLTYLVQAGMIKYLVHRDLPSTKICPLDLQSKDRKLTNSDLIMTYMIMATGLAAAAAVFIGEIILKRYLNVKITSKWPNKEKQKDIQTTISTVKFDDSLPPPYESLFGKNSRFKKLTEKNEHRVINGREYWVVNTMNGDQRLIPLRTPSAYLYQRYK